MTGFDYFVAAIFAAALLALLRKARRSHRHYPPGPKGYPIVGNLWDMPSSNQWLTYAQWSKDYDSDIVHARFFGQSIVVLSSPEAVSYLLDKRSSIYSDRPATPILQDVLGFGSWNIVFMRYSPLWRHHRKYFNRALHANVVDSYQAVQSESTRKLLLSILDAPEKFRAHINSHTGRIVLKATYGYDVKPIDDYYVGMVEDGFQQFNEIYCTGKFYAVNLFPFLQDMPTWVPGFKFQAPGARFRALTRDIVNKPYDIVKAQIDAGTAAPCIVSENLERAQSESQVDPEEEQIIKDTAATVYGAAQDTTASTIASFILAMLINPDQQKKAQADIDALTRGVRLPDYGDKQALPYLQCILMETLRWAPAVPPGVPHRVMEDDVYKGYDIPKGSIVIGNIWAILHDESVFPNPAKFDADRFAHPAKDNVSPLGCNKHLEDYVLSAAFGFGRRICPGRHMALNSAWLAIAQILATFDILKVQDEEGKDIEPVVGFTNGLTSHPAPFECRFVPRSAEAVLLLSD